MPAESALQKVLGAFERYYTIKTENVPPPFAAEAEFHSHSEQYFLVRAAKVADIDSHEYVFFASEGAVDAARVAELDDAAWREGAARVRPCAGHRNTDVSLIILADSISADAFRAVRRAGHSKSYRLGLWGWSNYRIAAYELSSGRVAANRLGAPLKRLVCVI